MNAITKTSLVAVLITKGLGLAVRAAEDAGPAAPGRSALDREMNELNGQIEQNAHR